MRRQRRSLYVAAPLWLIATLSVTSTGLPAEALPDFVEVPARSQTFYIARHEVTVAQFAAFVRASKWTVDQRALTGPPARPATFVSWPDALAYCRWLELQLTRASSAPAHLQKLLRDGWRVTLPTDAEWDHAPRGTADLWEWTRSPYHADLDADALWVIRRNHLRDGPPVAQATDRGGADPGARRPFIGFRVVISRTLLVR